MQLFGSWMDEVIEALEGAADDAERLIAANNFVREIMKRNHPAPLWFIRIADRWLTESASPQVADLVAGTGRSIRSVGRMTKHYYGLEPRHKRKSVVQGKRLSVRI